MTILFAYDGSESAGAAISSTATLLARQNVDAVVVTIWEPLMVSALHAANFGGIVPVPIDTTAVDKQIEEQARTLAEDGARIARETGFSARAEAIADTRRIGDAIVTRAEQLNADLIVLGARGLTGVRAFLGSVSNHVLQDARRPVLVIPAKEDA